MCFKSDFNCFYPIITLNKYIFQLLLIYLDTTEDLEGHYTQYKLKEIKFINF